MMTIWDDFSNYHWSFALERKSEALATFIAWRKKEEKRTGHVVKRIRSDNGGEYTSKDYESYLRDEGITQETTIPRTPQQNGKAERGMRTIEEKLTCALRDARELDPSYWAEAMNYATFTINRIPSASINHQTPFQAYHKRKPDLTYLRAFGSIAYALDPERKKHQSKAIKCIFLGYGEPEGKKAYRLQVFGSPKRAIIYSRDVIFDETFGALKTAKLPTVGSNGSREVEEKEGIDQPKEEKAMEEAQPSKQPEVQQDPLGKAEAGKPKTSRLKPSWYYEEVNEDQPAVQSSGSYGRGMRNKRSIAESADTAKYIQTDYDITDFVSEDFVGHAYAARPNLEDLPSPSLPKTYEEAMASEHAYFWREAMDEEMASMEGNGVFELTELPSGSKTVGGRWVYALKKGADGRITRSRLDGWPRATVNAKEWTMSRRTRRYPSSTPLGSSSP